MVVPETKNPLLLSFLEDDEHRGLFKKYCSNPNIELKQKIDDKFITFYSKIRLISYFSKAIHFASQDFDKKQRLFQSRNQLLLNQPFSNEDGNETGTLLDSIADDRSEIKLEELFENLEDYIQEKSLYQAISSLTLKQKHILYLSYIKNLSDTHIAERLNISQQAVTKTKNKALVKVRRNIGA
ncbi:sigma-70 family RNA polymerase sigma factor [Cytobacillus sp. S13-E01]|uniref:sigma-70 family RNA polymerase sigma factor n=1 Tax=Cytobacillus sp. S13-E01 TaxID=3031326 RepID=UPI0023D8A4C3|nr:sigma-70 family RNA polymerase sigma factor [Cytobacillus sp. S13-E01]MDF0725781.1 sigma-70 family RNA polymerase sigma factor [Cytobacillus sp. S13-E01]